MPSTMAAQPTTYVDLLERQLELSRLLMVELCDSKTAIATLDLRAIEQQTLRQESICCELAFVREEIARVESPDLRLAIDATTCEKLASLRQRIAEAEQELTRANRVQEALVRRSRRSINVMVNVFSTCSVESVDGSRSLARYI
ncbi:MAG TPA: hypothetical protein VD837_13670 [Terriglobales bacterium]|nr:hypothetical protein [Terriglobales bacterium]